MNISKKQSIFGIITLIIVCICCTYILFLSNIPINATDNTIVGAVVSDYTFQTDGKYQISDMASFCTLYITNETIIDYQGFGTEKICEGGFVEVSYLGTRGEDYPDSVIAKKITYYPKNHTIFGHVSNVEILDSCVRFKIKYVDDEYYIDVTDDTIISKYYKYLRTGSLISCASDTETSSNPGECVAKYFLNYAHIDE